MPWASIILSKHQLNRRIWVWVTMVEHLTKMGSEEEMNPKVYQWINKINQLLYLHLSNQCKMKFTATQKPWCSTRKCWRTSWSRRLTQASTLRWFLQPLCKKGTWLLLVHVVCLVRVQINHFVNFKTTATMHRMGALTSVLCLISLRTIMKIWCQVTTTKINEARAR